MAQQKSREEILEAARALLAAEGLGAVSFDAIARRLGRSKQAVLYWFPSKPELLAALFLPWLKAESAVARAALEGTPSPNAAIAAFVRGVARFHLEDLDRFRMMYLVPQTLRPAAGTEPNPQMLEQIHPVTGALYTALAERLEAPPEAARAEALAIHSAVLGLVLMVALADTLHDPLRHGTDALIEALIARLAG